MHAFGNDFAKLAFDLTYISDVGFFKHQFPASNENFNMNEMIERDIFYFGDRDWPRINPSSFDDKIGRRGQEVAANGESLILLQQPFLPKAQV